MMKSILCVAGGVLLTLAFSISHAQEAQIERVHIYENERGIIYHNEAFHISQEGRASCKTAEASGFSA